MARQLDPTALTVLTKLLDKVTDKHETHQDGAAVQQIKALCKQSDENITLTSSALLHRLKEDHAQVPHACPYAPMFALATAVHLLCFTLPCINSPPLAKPQCVAAPVAFELSAYSLYTLAACRRGCMW